MQYRSRWTELGIAAAIGLLVVLLIPLGASILTALTSPGRPNDRQAPGVVATLERWMDRVVNLDFTGPRGLFADSSSLNLALLALSAVLLFMVAPRLVLLVLVLIVGLPLLVEGMALILPGQRPWSSSAPGREGLWARVFEPGLFRGSVETLVLLGILVMTGIAFMQRRQHDERLSDDRDCRAGGR